MSNGANALAPVSLEQSLSAYEAIVSQIGYDPVIKPGRIEILGWDLEYLCGPVLANFIDQILVRRLTDFVPDNDNPMILDCGANIGFSVLNYKRQFPKANVVAFEPDPQFAPILRRNLERNRAGDVKVVEAAVWIRNGEAGWLCEGIDGSKIVGPGQEPPTTAVRTVDLAEYLAVPVDLLKLDIEGAEYQVVEHLGGRLEMVKNALIECHLNQSTILPFGNMLRVLVEAGFKVTVNSFGEWRDLVRQSPVAPNHWEQYLVVAAWRQPVWKPSSEDAWLPYAGVKPALELRALRDARDTARSELNTLRTREFVVACREKQFLQLLRAYLAVGSQGIQARALKPSFRSDEGRCWFLKLPELESSADDESNPMRSILVLFEDENLLGPPHSPHVDIRKKGSGSYSHWKSNLYFSSSDGSDPRTNGRKYTIVFIDNAARESLEADERQSIVGQVALASRNHALLQRVEKLNKREADLEQREAVLRQRQADLNERDAALRRFYLEFGERQTGLDQREVLLRQREGELQARESALGRDQAEFGERQQGLNQRESLLRKRESGLSGREVDLAKHQVELAGRREALEQREIVISQHEGDVSAREASLFQRESELQAAGAALSEREMELEDRLREFNSLLLVRAGSFIRRILKKKASGRSE